MANNASIVILDGGRRLPRADILHNNKGPGLFTRFTTTQLAAMEDGDHLAAVLGPLGQPTHVSKVGTVVCVGGGIGVVR